MNRLTDNDKNLGPLTIARWKGKISAILGSSGEDEAVYSYLQLIAFGWVAQLKLPYIIVEQYSAF